VRQELELELKAEKSTFKKYFLKKVQQKVLLKKVQQKVF
jgi:hypothetical protein